MKEVITKFLMIVVAIAAVMGFIYNSLWEDVKTVKSDTHQQIINANGATFTP